MKDIPVDLIVSASAIAAGVEAMERIHGRHLADMSPEEQEQARDHWRAQVEQVLAAVRDEHVEAIEAGAGRAVLTFSDAGEEEVDVGVAFDPDLRELPNGEVEGTPAQLLALSAIEAIAEAEDEA